MTGFARQNSELRFRGSEREMAARRTGAGPGDGGLGAEEVARCEVRAVVTQRQWAGVLDVSCLAASEQQRAAQTSNQRACVGGCGIGRRA